MMQELRNEAIHYEPVKKQPELRRIHELATDLLQKIKANPEESTGIPHSEWTLFNASFGGARGELVTLTSDTGQGKSTFAWNWLKDMVHAKNVNSCLFSLENPMSDICEIFARMVIPKNPRDLEPKEVGEITKTWALWPLWYFDERGMVEEDHMVNALYYAIQQKGCRFIVIDHLDYVKKAWNGRNESYVIGDFVRRLASIAHGENVTILLIVHPSKLNKPGVKTREVGMDELKGSSAIKQESDTVLNIFRPDPMKNHTYLRFLKIRKYLYGKSIGGKIQFSHNFDSQELWEMSAGLEYD